MEYGVEQRKIALINSTRSKAEALFSGYKKGDTSLKEFFLQGIHLRADLYDASSRAKNSEHGPWRAALESAYNSQEAKSIHTTAFNRDFIGSELPQFSEQFHRDVYSIIRNTFGPSIIDERMFLLCFPYIRASNEPHGSQLRQDFFASTLKAAEVPPKLEGIWYLAVIVERLKFLMQDSIKRPLSVIDARKATNKKIRDYWQETLFQPRDKTKVGLLFLEGYQEGVRIELEKAMGVFFRGERNTEIGAQILNVLMRIRLAEREMEKVKSICTDVFRALGQGNVTSAEQILKQAVMSHSVLFDKATAQNLGISEEAVKEHKFATMIAKKSEKNLQTKERQPAGK